MKLINKVKISLLIAIFIVILFNLNVFATTGIVTEITVNMRTEPSTDSKKIMYVTQDDVVEILEKDGDWYKIKFQGKTGYVFGEYVKVYESKLEESTTIEKEETIKKEEITINTEKDNTKEQTTENEEQSKNEDIDVNTNLIIKKNAKIKIVPNISSNVIYIAKKDININIIEQLKGWSYINVNGINGWIRTDKIVEKNEVLPDKEEVSKKEETNIEVKIAYIKYDTVNLRKKASTSSTVLAKLKLNDEVTVLEKLNGTWSKVEIDGMIGYVSTGLLANEKQEEVKKEEAQNDTTSRDGQTASREEEKVTNKKEEISKKEETTTTSTTNKTEIPKKEDITTKKEENDKVVSTKVTGEQVVEYAKKYLGCNYVYGGKTPKGFDCSGFTYYVYKNFGYNLSASSKGQATNGKEVAKSDLKPGDIIIFKNQSLTAIGHVGIYIGNNKIIHASEPGVGVIITDLDAKGYNYNKRYVTARRII